MSLIPPKTDWTEDDFFNADDMNRIEANTEIVANFLRSIGYNVPSMVHIKDRTKKSIDFISSINRIENNIEQIKNSFIAPPGYQEKDTWNVKRGFSYRDANRLENNLKLLYEWAIKVKENLKYCGTFACGEDGDIY